MWSNDNNQRNSTTKSWQWFAIERKFFLNHSVPSICDILCPKRKIGFPYVFEWVACKWLNEKNRWVCTDFCYISGNLKYRNVSFHLQEIVLPCEYWYRWMQDFCQIDRYFLWLWDHFVFIFRFSSKPQSVKEEQKIRKSH